MQHNLNTLTKESEVELILVNSIGPMASTCISGILEKIGYLNIPIRKVGLHEYLLNERSLADDFMKDRFIKIIKNHSKTIKLGGVSVKDRDTTLSKQIIKVDNMDKLIKEIKLKKFNSLLEMYVWLKKKYTNLIIYKKVNSEDGLHIELTTDLAYIKNPIKLIDCYKNEFGNIKVISLKRDFKSWVESLCSQRFAHPKLSIRLKINLYSLIKQYNNYLSNIKKIDGLIIDSDDIFNDTSGVIGSIESLTNKKINKNIENENFDLYSNICSYKKAFNKADNIGDYLSKTSLLVINLAYYSKNFKFLFCTIFSILYIFEYINYIFSKKIKINDDKQ